LVAPSKHNLPATPIVVLNPISGTKEPYILLTLQLSVNTSQSETEP